MSRTQRAVALIAAALVLVSAMTVPVAAQSAEDVDPVTEEIGGEAIPTVVVHYSADSLDSLEAWVNESADRALVSTDTAHRTAVVAAPEWQARDLGIVDRLTAMQDAGLDALTTDPLASQGWIEAVYLNYNLSLTRPDTLQSTDFEPPQIGALAFNDPDLPTEGLAFSDEVSAANMSVARAAIGADNVSANGTGVTISVIDSGCNVAGGTLGLQDNLLDSSKDFIENGTVAENGTDAVSDPNGHGSFVTSQIFADPDTSTTGETFEGVAPGADLLCARALNENGSGSTADIARAIRYSADKGADILQMSLGAPVYSTELADAIRYARANGTVVVAAAGNSRHTVRWVASPASADGVIAVGATTVEEPSTARSAHFSQIGPHPGTTDLSGGATVGEQVTVAAPGYKIQTRVATTSGATETKVLSGTSMAAPLQSGALAAAMAANTALATSDPATVATRVRQSARPVESAAVVEVGHGMAAADHLADGTELFVDQPAAMTDAAGQRDQFYRALSDASGGAIGQLLATLG